MLLFITNALGVTGYTLIYAAIKGDGASINGTPLWKAPWLPLVAALAGQNNVKTPSSSSNANIQPNVGSNSNTGNGSSQPNQSLGQKLLNGFQSIIDNAPLIGSLFE